MKLWAWSSRHILRDIKLSRIGLGKTFYDELQRLSKHQNPAAWSKRCLWMHLDFSPPLILEVIWLRKQKNLIE